MAVSSIRNARHESFGTGALALVPLFAFAFALGLGACTEHYSSAGNPFRAASTDAHDSGSLVVDAGDAMTSPSTDASVTIVPCTDVKSNELVPARDVVSAVDAAPSDRAVFTGNIYDLFVSACGGCHVDTNRGDFQIKSLAVFASGTRSRQKKIHDRLHSDDPLQYMPPPGAQSSKPWSERKSSDPVVELATLLDAWFAAGSPSDLFYMKADKPSGSSPYTLPKKVAGALTNIGSCLPAKAIIAREVEQMDQLDDFFAHAETLPDTLEETDLTTFDSETLARSGVISFAPAYPLFSDDAHKMRHIRLPRGSSLVFDKDKQELEVPENTRVYKTFFKKILDKNGHERYQKIETRLIVSRQDGPDAEDGSHETRSLYGSYAWNQDETEATLVTDPLRNGKPFRDRLFTYVTDEAKAAAVLAKNPFDKVVALREAGASRHYAIPGSERCVQCHMGSHNRSFLLGLTPLQLNRRAGQEGGVYETASADELQQLQRLIDYGVITGIDSPSDVLPLEAVQGDRKPRNDYELKAQAYMLGNCAHCHNPRGYPTTQNPVLKDLLRFFPDHDGGVFQFPIDRVSPRIKRGAAQDIDIAYITPSLFDREPDGSSYLSKHVGVDESSIWYAAAPWRSLIYRNVDSPYVYAEDYALYPHMPMSSSGFDARAPAIFADWMISIPAVLRQGEDGLPIDEIEHEGAGTPLPQPFVEVKPNEERYQEALQAAQDRLTAYHVGGRAQTDVLNSGALYTYFSNTRYKDYSPDTSDIVDPNVTITSDVSTLTPRDLSFLPSLYDPTDVTDTSIRAAFSKAADGVPDHFHWVVTDTTDASGKWYPRRSDWDTILKQKQLDGLDESQKQVVEILSNVSLSAGFKQFAVKPEPFGFWQDKSSCDFKSVPTLSSLAPVARPTWVSEKVPAPAESAPLYFQSPGQMVFNEICVNCHGPKWDSHGRQADTLMLMTGGDTRVANLRDGLLGPIDAPGKNRSDAETFGKYATHPPSDAAGFAADVDDWTARYVAWMGLGGTQRVIPQAILSVVGAAQVLGEERNASASTSATSANMLSIARTLCENSIGRVGPRRVDFDLERGVLQHALKGSGTALIADNGDAETWTALCSYENPAPVRVLLFEGQGSVSVTYNALDLPWHDGAKYPSAARIGDQHGASVLGYNPSTNDAPWCVKAPTDPKYVTSLSELQAARPDRPIPICPAAWLADETAHWTDARLDTWSLRAAMNAGFSVFLYLDQLEKDAAQGKAMPAAYDHCEDLTP